MSAGEGNQPWESYITANWAKEIEKTLNTELNERQTFFKTARKMGKENFNLHLYIYYVMQCTLDPSINTYIVALVITL